MKLIAALFCSVLFLDSAFADKACDALLASAKAPGSGDLVKFAQATDAQGYLYPAGGKDYLPVVALQKRDLKKYLARFGDDTISFIYRSDSWHSYVRIGRLFIDLTATEYSDQPGFDHREVNIRNAETMFRKSKRVEWKEGILKLDKKTVQMMQWFFLYRSELFKLINSGKVTECAWDIKFNERPRNYDAGESCAMFAHSPFVSLFHETLPPASLQKELRAKVTKAAKKRLPFAVKGQAPTLATVTKHMKMAQKKYGFDKYPSSKIKSQQGQMRLVNTLPSAVGFVLHNQDYDEFIRLNKMGFVPRTQTADPIDRPFDVKIRERISIDEI